MIRAVAPPSRTYWCESRMPRLPPVEKSPQARLRFTLWPGVGYSVFTFDQSHSSSSATSWARPVSVPCPISERAMRITQVSSGLTTTQAWTSTPAPAVVLASAEPSASGRRMPTARPPPAVADPTMKARRDRFMSGPLLAGGHVHRRPDALIRAAPADVGHRVVDVLVGRLRVRLQQRRRRHDLPGLAIAALGDVERRPGLLDGMRAGGRQALDGDDLVRGLHAADRDGAGARQPAVEVHGAGAALSDAAAVLGARQADLLADHPQERRVGLDLHVTDAAVDVQLWHGRPPGRSASGHTVTDTRRGAKEEV